jgi:quercetin dioxygenase-like cupin family protein
MPNSQFPDSVCLTTQRLERESAQRRSWRVLDLKKLAVAYDFHWSMLNPLLSIEANDNVCYLQVRPRSIELCSQWPDDKIIKIKQTHLARMLQLFRERKLETRATVDERLVQMRDKPFDFDQSQSCSRGPEYFCPEHRLLGTEDIATVLVTLRAGNKTMWHQHPGDELLFVLNGTINVQLLDTGVRTELHRGDFIHFYAEQKHSASSTGGSDATALVIRFLQLESIGTRYALHSKVTSTGVKAKDFTSRVRRGFAETLIPFDLTSNNENEERMVIDRLGLGRLLQTAAKAKGFSPADLLKRAKNQGLNCDKNRIIHTQQGQGPVKRSQLIALATLYDIYPVTLYDYLNPVYGTAIQVSNPEQPSGVEDWDSVPDEFVKTRGVKYMVPKRRLAYSDMSISIVQISPGSATIGNKHPGHELLLPISGNVQIEIGDRSYELRYDSHLYGHFCSGESHRVKNVDSTEAKMLVIRFYGGGRRA